MTSPFLVCASLVVALAGCSGPPSSPVGSIASGVGTPPSWLDRQGDASDTECNLVLRSADVTLEGRMGPETDCSTGACWVIINGNFDVSSSVLGADATPGVLYQSAIDGTWREAGALPTWNAGLGYRRFAFTLNHDTFTSGANSQTVHLIPFVRTIAGGRAFDHNRVADPLGAYQLSANNDWSIPADGSCPAAPPHGIRTLVFAQGWQQSGYGSLVENGKLDLNYDIYRIPSGLGCTHDGVPTVAVTAFAQFQPGGVTLSELIDGPLDPSTGKYQSLPLEFDVPANATQVALWFLDSSECNGDQWDSQFGANYVYSVAPN